jgi:hypothetical protein
MKIRISVGMKVTLTFKIACPAATLIIIIFLVLLSVSALLISKALLRFFTD